MSSLQRAVIDKNGLPAAFPTHRHDPQFWEQLGRAVATYGYLEETLARAIFALTATRPYAEAEIERAFAEWIPKLEKTISDPPGPLIDSFGAAIRSHPVRTIENLDELLDGLRAAAVWRNVLCHGSWPPPDSEGKSVPFFVHSKKGVFETAVDVAMIRQIQRHVAELTCEVVNTVTHMGIQFPGSDGPGRPVWPA